MWPLMFSKGDLYKTFTRPFQVENLTFHKGDLFGWKGVLKVTFTSSFLNLKVPISKTFVLLKVLFRAMFGRTDPAASYSRLIVHTGAHDHVLVINMWRPHGEDEKRNLFNIMKITKSCELNTFLHPNYVFWESQLITVLATRTYLKTVV